MARRSPRPRPSFCRRRTTICGNSLDVRTELPLFKRRSASGDISALRPEPIDGVSMRPKESGKVRYAYGVAMALLLGGTAFSLATGQAGAQVAQNAPGMGVVDTVTVTTVDRKEYTARIVGRDETSDLALLKIEGRGLPFVQWGDSTRARVGDWVIAIGDPYGVGSTVTAGIISALHRAITQSGAYDRYIQTDAAINMGNSGGPMFDLNGNVIGINSALISPTGASVGIGLAIPTELAKPVIDSLMRGQRPSRGYLGIGLQDLDENLAPSLSLPKDSGDIVRSVVAGGPGARAGLQQGDVIVRVNGQAVSPDQTVSYLIANTPVGSRVPLDIIRGGRRQTVTVQVGARPTEEEVARQGGFGTAPSGNDNDQPALAPQKALGLSLTPLTPDLARAANLAAGAHGVIVTAVDPNSNAAERGFQRGDLIISVNNQPVASPADVVAAVETARRAGRSSVLLLVKRGNGPEQFVGVDISGR